LQADNQVAIEERKPSAKERRKKRQGEGGEVFAKRGERKEKKSHDNTLLDLDENKGETK